MAERVAATSQLNPQKSRLKDSELEQDEDLGGSGLKFDSKDYWKVAFGDEFKFKGGEIVPESEIRVKNSSLTMFQVASA